MLYCLYKCGHNEVEINDDDVVEMEEEEGSKFEVFKICVCLCFEHVWSGLSKEGEAPPIPV